MKAQEPGAPHLRAGKDDKSAQPDSKSAFLPLCSSDVGWTERCSPHCGEPSAPLSTRSSAVSPENTLIDTPRSNASPAFLGLTAKLTHKINHHKFIPSWCGNREIFYIELIGQRFRISDRCASLHGAHTLPESHEEQSLNRYRFLGTV